MQITWKSTLILIPGLACLSYSRFITIGFVDGTLGPLVSGAGWWASCHKVPLPSGACIGFHPQLKRWEGLWCGTFRASCFRVLWSVILWKSTGPRPEDTQLVCWPPEHSHPAGVPAPSKHRGTDPLHITLRCHQDKHPGTCPGAWFRILDISWMKQTVATYLKFPHQTICPQRMGIINLEERKAVKRLLALSGS